MGRILQPVRPLRYIGPATDRGDPPRDRFDIALDPIEPRHLIGEPLVRNIALRQITEHPADEARVRIDPQFGEIRDAAGGPQSRDLPAAHAIAHAGFLSEPLEHLQVGRFGRGAQAFVIRSARQAGDQCLDARQVRLAVAPVQPVEPREAMRLDRGHFFGFEGIGALRRQPAERAVALVPPRATGDLRHLRHRQATALLAVEFRQAGKGDMTDIEVQPHADRVGRHQIVDLAGLKHRHLRVACARRQRPHHHRRAAAQPAQHFGGGIDFLGGEGDDRGAAGQPRQLLRAGISERRETRPLDDLDIRHQRAQHRAQRFGAEDHRLLASPRAQDAIGEHMAALAIGAELRLVQRDERDVALQRQALGGAQEPARVGRHDPLLAGDQRDALDALDGDHPVVHLARQQP